MANAEARERWLGAWLSGQLRFGVSQQQMLHGSLARTLTRFAGSGSLEGIAAMLASGADVNGSQAASTPLIAAVHGGRADAVDLLLVRGADPNRMTPSLGSPLLIAAMAGRAEMVERLLNSGAIVDQVVCPAGKRH